MDEREAKARGLIDTLELPEQTVEVDHWLMVPVLALKRGVFKEDEVTYSRQQGQMFKVFHPWDINMERLAQQAVRETMQKLREQSEAENPL